MNAGGLRFAGTADNPKGLAVFEIDKQKKVLQFESCADAMHVSGLLNQAYREGQRQGQVSVATQVYQDATKLMAKFEINR